MWKNRKYLFAKRKKNKTEFEVLELLNEQRGQRNLNQIQNESIKCLEMINATQLRYTLYYVGMT